VQPAYHQSILLTQQQLHEFVKLWKLVQIRVNLQHEVQDTVVSPGDGQVMEATQPLQQKDLSSCEVAKAVRGRCPVQSQIKRNQK
jgi:hypothetical protein